MSVFALHGSRQRSDERPFHAASANLDDWRRGGSPSRDPTYKLPRSFTLFLCFRPCLSWFKREEGSWQNQTTRPTYASRVPSEDGIKS